MKIKDKCLEPYFIEVQENSYTVSRENVGKEGKVHVTTHDYFTDLDFALRKIAKLKMQENNVVYDLQSYFGVLNSYLNQFSQSINHNK